MNGRQRLVAASLAFRRPMKGADRRLWDLPAEGDGETGQHAFFIDAKTFVIHLHEDGSLAKHESVAGELHLAETRAAPGAGQTIVKPHGNRPQ
jgi:hypothetical protein